MFAFWRATILALLVVLFPLAASARGWGHRRSAVTSYYYYPMPATYYYAPSVPVIYAPPAPAIIAPASPPVYAVPSPAPALSAPPTAAPPTPAPGVTESRSSSGETPAASPAPAAGLVTVAFWNRSDRDEWVRIAGEWRFLRQGRGLTLDLPRDFAWQVQGRNTQQERIPTEKSALQIAIRR